MNGNVDTPIPATLTTHRSHQELLPDFPVTPTDVLQAETETKDEAMGILTWIEQRTMDRLIQTSHPLLPTFITSWVCQRTRTQIGIAFATIQIHIQVLLTCGL